MTEYLSTLLKNPKTTLSGFVVALMVGLYLMKFIDGEMMTIALGVLMSYGLISGADAKKKDE